MNLSENLEEIEEDLLEIFSHEPKQLSSRVFQLKCRSLLCDYMGFSHAGEYAQLNQFHSDVFESRFFTNNPVGFVKKVPSDQVQEKFPKLRVPIENISQVNVFKKDDVNVRVYSHHASIEDYITKKLRSKNPYISTTIASDAVIIPETFTTVPIMENPLFLIEKWEKDGGFSEDVAINYRPKDKNFFIYTHKQILEHSKRNIRNQ
ncbi:MAG: hypothetical protein JW700_03025 [Candidatus Aenigmarchaeota archaeon]|nr:hypothetical protein [Candidatus Aenigmarchaeota archaeon]